MQALNGIPFLGLRDRKKRFGIFIGILYAHAAMTVSACELAKQIFVWRVVLINEKLIWKVEAHAAKRIPIARWLIYSDRAVAVAANSQADPRERGWIARKRWKIFFRIIDGGTFHVGLNVMYFMVSARSGVACFPG